METTDCLREGELGEKTRSLETERAEPPCDWSFLISKPPNFLELRGERGVENITGFRRANGSAEDEKVSLASKEVQS